MTSTASSTSKRDASTGIDCQAIILVLTIEILACNFLYFNGFVHICSSDCNSS
jgi:hypothetical protein